MRYFKNTMILGALVAIAFTSCRKEEEEPMETQMEEMHMEDPDVKLHMDHKWGDSEFALGEELDLDGITLKFDEIRFYMSSFVAVNDASESDPLDAVILIDAGNTSEASLGSMDFSHLHKLQYVLGLDAETNHADPTAASAPLNDATMHWGWDQDSGYKMMKIEGQIDMDGDGTFDGLTFHCATDAVMREAELEIHGDSSGGEHNHVEVELTVDYKAFFNGIDFGALAGQTHGGTDATNLIMTNAAAAITVSE